MAKGFKTGGRAKGTPNKMTGQVKEMILTALDRAGGVEYLVRQANDSPTAFLALVGKVLPMQVTGADGNAVKVVTEVVLRGVRPDGDG